jgi:hypothetical protein
LSEFEVKIWDAEHVTLINPKKRAGVQIAALT